MVHSTGQPFPLIPRPDRIPTSFTHLALRCRSLQPVYLVLRCSSYLEVRSLQKANMLSASLAFLITILLTSLVSAHSPSLVARQDCANNYSKCSPSGATATNTPSIGGELSSLYVNIVNSISGIKVKARDVNDGPDILQARAPSNSVCCKLDNDTCRGSRS